MRIAITAPLVAVLALGACRSATVSSEAGPTPSAAPAPATAGYIPIGTDLTVNLNQEISTANSRPGDAFTATVTQPVMAQNGATAIPQGAVVHGTVTGVKASGSVGSPAAVRLDFQTIDMGGQSYPFAAAITKTDVDVNQRTLDQAAKDAGIGAAAGAALGAVLGGSLSKAITGAIVGAGAGTLISLGTGDVQAVLPQGTDLTLRTTQAIRR